MSFEQAALTLAAVVIVGATLIALAAIRVGARSERRDVTDVDARRRLEALGRATRKDQHGA